ncbi:globin domain-containing protein [Kitasatospora sp. NBC_01560]|uniref:globin domain-containing protein n=1 Tax=Kitasatospora sp. NBC_01560 TaxID=2975965 RepID=UPI00386572A7
MPFDPAVVRASFAVVERRADHLAKYFYAHLFTHNPGVRAFFPDEMAERRNRLFAALTQLVLRIGSPEELAEYLRALGRDHRSVQAVPEYCAAVGSSLVAAVRHFSGHSWTLEIEKAWTEACTVITRVMTEIAAHPPAAAPVHWEAEVTGRRRAAADIAVLTLTPVHPYPFVPGQYLTLSSPRVPGVWRPYSIANAPRPDHSLDVHVRRVPGGLLSTALVDDVLPGEPVRLGPALGDAVLDPWSPRPLLAVAGGTGWGQTKALLEQLDAERAARDVTVLLAARSDVEQYDLASVERLLARCGRLKVLLAAGGPGDGRDGAIGLVRDALLRHGDWSGWDVHLSGPPDLAPALTSLLAGLGADTGLVRHDPAPATFRRARPPASSWFPGEPDAPWTHPTEQG